MYYTRSRRITRNVKGMMTMMKTLRLIIGSLLLVGVLVSGFVYQAEYKYFIDLAVVIIAMNVLPHPKLTFR